MNNSSYGLKSKLTFFDEFNFLNEPAYEARLTAAERKALPDEAYGLPKLRKYPLIIKNEKGEYDWSHLRNAISYFHTCKDESLKKELAGNIAKTIKKYNIDINISAGNSIRKYASFPEPKAAQEGVLGGVALVGAGILTMLIGFKYSKTNDDKLAKWTKKQMEKDIPDYFYTTAEKLLRLVYSVSNAKDNDPYLESKIGPSLVEYKTININNFIKDSKKIHSPKLAYYSITNDNPKWVIDDLFNVEKFNQTLQFEKVANSLGLKKTGPIHYIGKDIKVTFETSKDTNINHSIELIIEYTKK